MPTQLSWGVRRLPYIEADDGITSQDVVALLRLYNERASELNESAFLREVRDGARTSFRLGGSPFRAVRESGPSNEAMKAFVLTFRLFIQDRDRLSFRTMAKMYTTLPVSGQLRQEVAEIIEDLRAFLDSRSPMVVNGTVIHRRELLQAWMYGEIAHVNPDKRATLASWRVADDVRPLWQHEFETVLLRLTQFIFWMRQVNIRAIEELTSDELANPDDV